MAWSERYVRTDANGSGDGTTDANTGATGSWTLAQAISTAAAGHRVNIKAGTYTRTASDTFANAGSATQPIWFRGFNTTIGDCDANTALTKPLIAYNATFSLIQSGNYQIWSSLRFTGNVTGAIFGAAGFLVRMHRLRLENTSSNAGCVSLYVTAVGIRMTDCWAKAPITATTYGVIHLTGGAVDAVRCIAEGGGRAGFTSLAGGGTFLTQCVALNNVIGVEINIDHTCLFGCTIRNSSGDGVRITHTPAQRITFVGNIFAVCGGYGINNNTTNNPSLLHRSHNAFYSCASGHENGMSDSPSFYEQTLASDPHISGTDLTLLDATTLTSILFENQAYTSYQYPGAVQRIVDVGGGPLIGRHRLAG